jgi:hypothetical protein
MPVRSLRFLGIRSAAAGEMVRLYRDVLGLAPALERPGPTWFRLADGTQVHVYTAPDGNVYELMGPDRLGPDRSPDEATADG